MLSATAALAQTAYRYKDSSGQWVYTDRAPQSAAKESAIEIKRQDVPGLHVEVQRRDESASTQLVAVSDCLCEVTFGIKILASEDPSIAKDSEYRALVQPRSEAVLVSIVRPSNAPSSSLRFTWRAALGTPGAQHKPHEPYRAPFAVGSAYLVSQAYPVRITHTAPDNMYAIDIALPDGTPVYAAREGTVINVRHDAYLAALDPVMLDQANVVEILHDDGTIAIYAHLHWDSIRVHIGQQVRRGVYIADSGNTGFSSGPHLHFAVIRNAGDVNVSVPVQFAGPGGAPVTPATRTLLSAY